MAKKSASKAEKTVNATKKKASAANNTSKSSGKKPAAKKPPAAKKNPKVSTEYENPISNGVTGGIVCVFLCVLFLLLLFKTDGALLLVTRSVVLGLIGIIGGFNFCVNFVFEGLNFDTSVLMNHAVGYHVMGGIICLLAMMLSLLDKDEAHTNPEEKEGEA